MRFHQQSLNITPKTACPSTTQCSRTGGGKANAAKSGVSPLCLSSDPLVFCVVWQTILSLSYQLMILAYQKQNDLI